MRTTEPEILTKKSTARLQCGSKLCIPKPARSLSVRILTSTVWMICLAKKLSIGEEESGTERNAKQILEAYGLSDELVDCENLDYTQAAEALVSEKIDAMFCTAGVQTTVIEELTRQRGIRLLSLDETHIQKLMAAYDFYTPYTIPVYTYSGQSEEATTVGVQSLLLVSDELSDKTVETLTEQLFSRKQDIQYSLPLDLQLDETSATEM